MTLSMVPNKEAGGPPTQQIEAQTADAGLPQTTGQKPPNFRNLTPPTPRSPKEFDAIESRTPTSFGQLRDDQNSRVLNALDTSPSPALRDIARRLRGI